MRCHRVGWYYGFSCKRRHKRRLLLHVHLLISTNPASKRRSLPRCGSSPFFLGGGDFQGGIGYEKMEYWWWC